MKRTLRRLVLLAAIAVLSSLTGASYAQTGTPVPNQSFGFKASAATAVQRETPLCEGWQFTLDAAANEFTPLPVANAPKPAGSETSQGRVTWEAVSLPHTWNAHDAQDSVRYLRTVGWYARSLNIPAEWKGQKRVFVRFEAASVVATVYLNGRIIGEHKGAFTAFCLELTDDLRYGQSNELRVEVDNRWRADVPPISGGFALFGGLYRPAQLIVTPLLGISPLHYASSGVYVDAELSGQVTVRTELEYALYSYGKMDVSVPESEARVVTVLFDAEGRRVAEGEQTVRCQSGTLTENRQVLQVNQPHLWQGIYDPYLYRAEVSVYQDSALVDGLSQTFGFRYVDIDPAEGFRLNGKPHPVFGVSRHQDLDHKGWALDYEDDLRDMLLMREMGVTAVRLAHYPQSRQVHLLADSIGFLIWDEISLVNDVRNSFDFNENSRRFFAEMIHQLYNHPSVAWWGIFNEIDHPETPYPNTLFDQLIDMAHRQGGQRLTASASNKGLRYYDGLADAPAWNNYPGWYWMLRWPYEENNQGRVGGFGEWMDYRSRELSGRRFALSEYGAGGNPEHHMDSPLPEQMMETMNSPYHPEEWQSYVLEEDWRCIQAHASQLWGSFVWAMFDFVVPGWGEGGLTHLNTKGLVTVDRQTRKDAFYFFKANWNPEPMLHLASKRFTQRHQAVTEVKAYTNCPSATLYVNGKKAGQATADEIHVCRFREITLQPGRNRIEVRAVHGRQRLTDRAEWWLEE